MPEIGSDFARAAGAGSGSVRFARKACLWGGTIAVCFAPPASCSRRDRRASPGPAKFRLRRSVLERDVNGGLGRGASYGFTGRSPRETTGEFISRAHHQSYILPRGMPPASSHPSTNTLLTSMFRSEPSNHHPAKSTNPYRARCITCHHGDTTRRTRSPRAKREGMPDMSVILRTG